MWQSHCSLQQGPAALIRSAGISTLPRKAVSWLWSGSLCVRDSECTMCTTEQHPRLTLACAGCRLHDWAVPKPRYKQGEKLPVPHQWGWPTVSTNSRDVVLERLLPLLCKKIPEVCSAFPSDAASQGEDSRKGNNSSRRCMSEWNDLEALCSCIITTLHLKSELLTWLSPAATG